MKHTSDELKSIREPKDAETESWWWTIWATHNANDATIQETAQTFGTDRTTAWRAIAWCSRELKDGRGAAECIEGQIYTKKQRLREVRKMRAECMGNKDHTPALGYLREERELEHDIAELEGAKRLLVSIEHTGPGGKELTITIIPPAAETVAPNGD